MGDQGSIKTVTIKYFYPKCVQRYDHVSALLSFFCEKPKSVVPADGKRRESHGPLAGTGTAKGPRGSAREGGYSMLSALMLGIDVSSAPCAEEPVLVWSPAHGRQATVLRPCDRRSVCCKQNGGQNVGKQPAASAIAT